MVNFAARPSSKRENARKYRSPRKTTSEVEELLGGLIRGKPPGGDPPSPQRQ